MTGKEPIISSPHKQVPPIPLGNGVAQKCNLHKPITVQCGGRRATKLNACGVLGHRRRVKLVHDLESLSAAGARARE